MPVIIFNFPILMLVVAVAVALTAGHAVEQEQPPTKITGHGYGPAIHISSGVLQLTPDTEKQLLVVPSSVHSSQLAQPCPHFYVDALASHLPHAELLPQPTVVISDNLDFSQLKHPFVKSHGR